MNSFTWLMNTTCFLQYTSVNIMLAEYFDSSIEPTSTVNCISVKNSDWRYSWHLTYVRLMPWLLMYHKIIDFRNFISTVSVHRKFSFLMYRASLIFLFKNSFFVSWCLLIHVFSNCLSLLLICYFINLCVNSHYLSPVAGHNKLR